MTSLASLKTWGTITATLLALTHFSAHSGDAIAATDDPVAFQISIAHNGIQTVQSFTPPLLRRWQVILPGLVSYPLIAQGLVFVTAGDSTTGISTLYALDQLTGKTVWSQPLIQPPPIVYPWANAAYDNGRIFTIGTAGLMSAYEAGSGTPLWSTALPFQYLFSSPPTAANGVVYTGGAGSGGTVYAVDEASGSVLATQSVQNGDHSAPALSSTDMFMAYACNQAYGFQRAALSPHWHYNTFCEGGGGRTTVYAGGRVYTRDYFGNLILDAVAGTSLGSYGPLHDNFVAIPAVRGSTMWLLNGGTLAAQDMSVPSASVTLWTFAGDGQLVTAPIVLSTPSGDVIVEGSASGTLYALNAVSGEVMWTTNIGAAIGRPDEFNIAAPLTGLGAGQGLLVVPAGTTVSAFFIAAPVALPATPVPAVSNSLLLLLAVLLTLLALRTKATRP